MTTESQICNDEPSACAVQRSSGSTYDVFFDMPIRAPLGCGGSGIVSLYPQVATSCLDDIIAVVRQVIKTNQEETLALFVHPVFGLRVKRQRSGGNDALPKCFVKHGLLPPIEFNTDGYCVFNTLPAGWEYFKPIPGTSMHEDLRKCGGDLYASATCLNFRKGKGQAVVVIEDATNYEGGFVIEALSFNVVQSNVKYID